MSELDVSYWMKSCPNCSRKAGVVVYKRWPDEFGVSEARRGSKSTGTQSWCSKCRREQLKEKRIPLSYVIADHRQADF